MSHDLVLVNCVQRNHDGSIQQSGQLGLLYIAGVAKTGGYTTKILAGDSLGAELLEVVQASPRPLVGFYVNSDNLHEVLRLATFLKSRCAHAYTITGGPVANVVDGELLANPAIDFVGRGDGEHLVRELLDCVAGGKLSSEALGAILGLSYRASDGVVVRNPPRPLIEDLDSLPIPDRSIYPSTQAGIKSQMVTARGCGFRCTFCFESTNRRYRAHSPARVIDEMLVLQREYGTTYFAFVDDIFTQNPKRLHEICKLLHRHFKPHENLFWYCEARVDALARHPDLVPMMRDAGLTRIQIGTESGSQAVVDAYKKQITLDQVRTAVEQLENAKVLSIFTNLIIGGAHETRKTFRQTLKFTEDLLRMAPGRLECNTSFLSPYPGTDIASHPDRYGVSVLDPSFETGLSDDHIFVETHALDKTAILRLQREFKERVWVTMASLIPTLPVELILEHLRLNRHNLQTAWSDFLRSDEIIGSFSQFLQSGSYVATIPDGADPADIMPARSFAMRRCMTGKLEWKMRNRTIEFEPYEQFLLERASGKLSLSDIADRAYAYWHGEVEKAELLEDIKEYFQSMADEMLLVFRVMDGSVARLALAQPKEFRAASAGDAGLGFGSRRLINDKFNQASRRGARLRVLE